jgi:hypothetical protein
MTHTVPDIRKSAVLIVECPEVRTFLHFLLTRAGMNVIEADPECGGQTLAEHMEDVELIIANRPKELVASGIPIIYIASIPDAEMVKQCAHALPKPFRPADLLFQVERIRSTQRKHGVSA